MNDDKEIAVYDNSVSAREYIGYISESAGGFACIGRDGKLYIKTIGQDSTTIPLSMFGKYKWGEEFQISKVSYEDGLRSFKFGNNTRNNIWINQDNMYIVDEQQIENIYDEINGLTINSFEGKTIIDPAIDIGDIIIIDNKPIIYQGENTFEGRFIAEIKSIIQIKQKEETTVKKESQKNVNRRVQSNIDQINGEISTLIRSDGEKTQQLSRITQDLEEIKSEISNVSDVTETKSGTGQLTFEDINESEPINISIRPQAHDIIALYPSDTLYPSNNLYPHSRDLYFINTTDNTVRSYDLPCDLLWFDAETYDEFTLDYETHECYVIHRVGFDNNRNKIVLANVVREDFAYPKIQLTEGNYTIKIKSNLYAYIYARLMIKSIYTNQFATKVELNSSIKQTKEQISLNVNKTLTNYPTNTQMNSAIELTAGSINSKVSETYSTKTETSNAKSQAISSANSHTDTKLQDYSTTTQMDSAIRQKAKEINISVSEKISAIQVGAENLLLNTGLKENDDNFSLSAGVTRVTKKTPEGNYCFKYDVSGLTADNWRSANPSYVDISAGEKVTASANVYIPSGVTNSAIYLEIQYINSSGTRISMIGKPADLTKTNQWQTVSIVGATVPANTVKANARVWIQRNGQCYVGDLKLSKGNTLTSWSPAPKDIEDYADAKLELKIDKDDNNRIVSMLNASAGVITLNGGSSINLNTPGKLIISAGNFRLDANGNITANNATLTNSTINGGSLITKRDGKTAMIMEGTTLEFYNYSQNDLNPSGWLASTYRTNNNNICGVDLYCDNNSNRYINLSVRNTQEDIITTVIGFNGNILNENETPYIANTANGILFPDVPQGGIKVKNGLITDWSMPGTTGTLFSDAAEGGIEVKDGLITGWSLNLPTFDLSNVTITGIRVVEGFVKSITYIQN